jgi:hypothetical protein
VAQQFVPGGQQPSGEYSQQSPKQHLSFGQQSKPSWQQIGKPGWFGHAYWLKSGRQMRAHRPCGSHDSPGWQQALLQQLLSQQRPPQISSARQHEPSGMHASPAAQQLRPWHGVVPAGQHWPSSRQVSKGAQQVVSWQGV